MTLPEDTAEKVEEWAEREGHGAGIMERLPEFDENPAATLEAMRGD